MSDLLSIGASGVRAYQSALSVTGENIANSGAAGYVRRSVRLTEMGAGAGLVAEGQAVDEDVRFAAERDVDAAALRRAEDGVGSVRELGVRHGGSPLGSSAGLLTPPTLGDRGHCRYPLSVAGCPLCDASAEAAFAEETCRTNSVPRWET